VARDEGSFTQGRINKKQGGRGRDGGRKTVRFVCFKRKNPKPELSYSKGGGWGEARKKGSVPSNRKLEEMGGVVESNISREEKNRKAVPEASTFEKKFLSGRKDSGMFPTSKKGGEKRDHQEGSPSKFKRRRSPWLEMISDL